MNSFSGIGRVGKTPEFKDVNGKEVAQFSVAIDSGYGDNKVTTWFKVSLWEKRAKVASYIEKGDRIGVTGEVVERKYKDKEGIERSSLELVNAGVTLLADKRESSGDTPAKSAKPSAPAGNDPFDDDVPF